MERWLLISNCATNGLAQSMQLLQSAAKIDAFTIEQLQQTPDKIRAGVADYDRAFLFPPAHDSLKDALDPDMDVTVIPSFYFSGYHPDLCYVKTASGFVKTDLDDYHSGICAVAFMAGLGVADTLRLFTAETYERLGYFDNWIPARNDFLKRFADQDLDIRSEFLTWVRRGPFMYSVNHPVAGCLLDIATVALKRIGLPVRTPGFAPVDHLANGPWFPVYPELADSLGVPGAYLFKKKGVNALISLEEFVQGSFAAYARLEPGSFEIFAWPKVRQQKLLALLGQEAA
jgi:hypothetical protein